MDFLRINNEDFDRGKKAANAFAGELGKLVTMGRAESCGSAIKVADYDLQDGIWIELQMYRNTDPGDFSYPKRFHVDDIADFLRKRDELTETRPAINGDGKYDTYDVTITIYDWLQNAEVMEKLVLFELYVEKRKDLQTEMDEALRRHEKIS